MQCRFVHPEQVENGFLEREGICALILPYTLAMSDDEIRAVESFVRRGGLLIADYLPAAMDWHCRPREGGGLDRLLGIQSRGITADFLDGKAVLGRAASPARKDSEILSCLGTAGVRVATGRAAGTFVAANRGNGAGQWPAIVVNRAGKGRTLYLNFLYDYRCDYTDPAAQPLDRTLRALLKETLAEVGIRAPLAVTADGKEQSYLEVVPCHRDKADCFFILQDYLFPQGQADYHKERVRVVFPKRGYVYDMRRGKFLGLSQSVEVRLSPGDATALCLLPYEVEAVKVTGTVRARVGTTPKFEIALTASQGAPGNHVVRVEVVAPEGKRLSWYTKNLSAPGGRAVFVLPLAVNDREGIWTITARDVLTGKTGEARLLVYR